MRTLDSNGLSYFASLLPEKIHKNVTFSDYIYEIVQNESDKTSCSYRLLDIKQPPDDLKDSQYCVTAINVFDVIKRKDLFKVARGCEKILQKDGIAMVLADRPFDLSPLYDTHSLPEKLVVPWILYYREVGVKTVSVDELKPYLAQLNAPLSNFFERILNLTPTQRHEFLSFSLYKRSDLVFFLNDLMDCLDCENIHYEQSYENDVKQAFLENGFSLELSGFQTASVFSNCEISTDVKVIRDLRISDEVRYLPSVKKGSISTMEIISTFHVLIFRKKRPNFGSSLCSIL